MFIDWLTIYQDHPFDFPIIIDDFVGKFSSVNNKVIYTKEHFQHAGSFSTSIAITISGGRIKVSGNPSRVGRPDNLFGFYHLDDCVAVYNQILANYGLPPFKKGNLFLTAQNTDEPKLVSDGAYLTEIHLTTNLSVGQSNELDYLKGIACLPYRNSRPNLYDNGMSVDWKSKKGNASQLIYPTVYNKAHDLQEKTLPKVKREFGVDSPEYKYILDLIDYCKSFGVIRWEQKFKHKFLRDNNLNHYGHIDWSVFEKEHKDFLDIQQKLKVEAMTFEHIAEKLISEGIASNTLAANTTANYAFLWMNGKVFDCTKRAEQTHRARLRKIGIDISTRCDLTKFSPVFIKEIRQVNVTPLKAPSWYQHPKPASIRVAA